MFAFRENELFLSVLFQHLKHSIAVNSTISLTGKFCFHDRNYLDAKAIKRALMLD